VELLGIRFAPGGTLPFLPVPPGELTDRIIPLDELARAWAEELCASLEAVRTWQEKFSVVEAVLIRRLCAASLPRVSLQPGLARLVRSGGRLSVEQLAADLGLSHRQLQRRFLQEVGLGPKLLGRILRFQQVFRAVEQPGTDWASVALECGYYDQAHLIRDFRQFAGQTPAVLFEDLSRLTELFTRKRRRSHFSNTSS
jgi:AraC-like DNA-binding protein